MKKTVVVVFGLLMILSVSLVSCKKKEVDPVDNPPVQNDEELITTMKLTFIDSAGIEPNKEFIFRDVDGPGGAAPTDFDTLFLTNNKIYKVKLTLLNEAVVPAENISDEVLNEADEHLFCFEPNLSGNLIVVRTDSDGTYELGLSSVWTTLSVSNGSILIKLKHQPGVKNGQCDPGETDIELNFPVKIQ